MRTSIRSIIGSLAVALLAFGCQPAFATDAYKIDQSYSPSTVSLDLVDAFASTGEGASFLIATTPRPGENMPDEHLCASFGPAPCDFANNVGLRGSLLAPVCRDATMFNCIESLSVYKRGGEATPAKFIKQSEGDIIAADPTHNLTEGSTKSLWSATQPHTGGTGDYAAYVQLSLSLTPDKKVHVASVTASVMPVTLVAGSWQPTRYSQAKTPQGREQVNGSGGPSECVWLESNSCGRLQDFAPETRVKLAVRVENTVGGWFKGRMKSPTIDVKPFSSQANVLTFDADPVAVPQFFARYDATNPDTAIAKWLSTQQSKPQNGGGQNMLTWDPNGFNVVDAFRQVTKDRSAGIATLWSAGTVMSGGNRCLNDHSKVLGLVTTNAMVYQGEAPAFENGSLNYKVAGLHYTPDGSSAVEGTYDLVMRSETARCLYGFSKAPVSATISVTSFDGEAKTATTMMTEKDGWLRLWAYGFTFSQNSIQAKITQAKQSATLKKSTITCVDGKLTKKVTAVAPKCPTGYKKKA